MVTYRRYRILFELMARIFLLCFPAQILNQLVFLLQMLHKLQNIFYRILVDFSRFVHNKLLINTLITGVVYSAAADSLVRSFSVSPSLPTLQVAPLVPDPVGLAAAL